MSREQVFWGWGEPGSGPSLPDHAGAFLRSELGVEGGVVSPPVALAEVRLAPSRLTDAARVRLEEIVGAEALRDDAEARVLRCRGKSYLDLLAQRAGDCEAAPDAVVAPADPAQVQAVLFACAEAGVAVVPFGGGTSVVGGLEPLRESFDALVSLDLGRVSGLRSLDERSLTAVLGAGTRLPEADRALAARGFTLGHLPQSYEWATVGGCVATRSAGQASAGFGRIEDNVVSLRCATPMGELATLGAPASAAGPSTRELVVGSEGTLGAITEVALRVFPTAPHQRYEGWFFHGFEDGCEALRALVQDGAAPDVVRLSDEEETRVSLALAGPRGLKGQAGGAFLRARGYEGGCLAILGWEGTGDAIARRHGPAARILRAAGAMAVGRAPGEAWRAGRFSGPHLRDDLLDRGVLVETLETATSWTKLAALHAAVGEALHGALERAQVACHVSHVYPTGASLYFTVLAAQDPGDPAAQWQRAKAAASDAIVAQAATITHHHAVGRDHVPWLGAETGALGMELLRAVRERCDPAGIMNPGKLRRGVS